MPINFTRHERPTIGIERELHLVDAEAGELVATANELLDEMGAEHPRGGPPTAAGPSWPTCSASSGRSRMAQRQRRLVESDGTLVDVVQHLVSEPPDDRPRP